MTKTYCLNTYTSEWSGGRVAEEFLVFAYGVAVHKGHFESNKGKTMSLKAGGRILRRWVSYCKSCPDQEIVYRVGDGPWVTMEISSY